MINVGVVDDHETITHGVAVLLTAQGNMKVAASARSPQTLSESAQPLDVVLLDLSLGDGSKVADNVAAAQALTPNVIAFTSGEQPHLIREATRSGVTGVVRKSAPPAILIKAIQAVHAGTAVPDAEWVAALGSDESFVSKALTAREVEVLSMYAGGETAKRVASALFISEDTVFDHIRNIRAKYAQQDRPVKTKIDLFRRAVQDGIISLDD